MADDQDKKHPPRYVGLEKLNIQQLEQKKIEDLERLNQIDNIHPKPLIEGKLKTHADLIDIKENEIQKQKYHRGIKEIDAEIARQKEALLTKQHRNEFNQLSKEQKTKILSKQFAKKLRADREQEKRDRGH